MMRKPMFYIFICLEILALVSRSNLTLVAEVIEDASQILSQSLQVTKTIEKAHPRALALVEIAGKYAELGQYDVALQVTKTIEKAHPRALALVEIAGKYVESR